MCFKNILKNIRSSVTIPRATKYFEQLLKGAEKKSNLVWKSQLDI